MGTPIAFTGELGGRYISTTFNRGTVAQNLVQNLSSSFSWWNGVDISNQYLIYSDTYSQAQAAYGSSRPTAWTTPDLTDASLLALINTLPDRVGQPGFTDIDIALNWMQGTNKYYLLKSGYENIVTSGLQINFDAAWYNSYSGTSNIYNINASGGVGTLNNGVSFFTYNGGVLSLDGADDYVSFNVPNLTTTATVEMWCRPTSIAGGDMFFGFLGYDIYTAGGNIGFNTGNGDVYGIAASTVSALGLENNWNHYVFEFRTDVSYTNNKIYINGVSFPLSQQIGGPGSQSFGNGDAYIGTWGYGGYNMAMFLGVCRVYNRSLTADEVRHNYNVQKARFGHNNIVTSGMTLVFDASNPLSYPGSGTNWINLGGLNNATLTNGPTFSTTNFGVIDLDGTNDYAATTYTTPAGNKTMDFWVYYDTLSSSGGGGYSLMGVQQNPNRYFYIGIQASNGQGYSYAGNTGGPYNYFFNAQEWYHVAMRMKDGTTTFYTNGVQVDSRSYANSADSTNPFNIGCLFEGGYQHFMDAKINNVNLYTRALSDSEIYQNFHTNAWKYGKGIDRYGLVMYCDPGNYESYPGSNILWKDLSGSGNNMTLYNGPTYNTSYGGVIQMDSTDDYARATNPNITLGTSPRTSILWIYATASVGGCIFGFGNSPNTQPTYGSMELWNYVSYLGFHFSGGNFSSGLNLGINLNKWLMCVLRYDGTTASVRIIDNGTVYSNSTTVGLDTKTANYSINKSAYAQEGAGFAGNVGISATYLRHLSDSQVTDFYNLTKTRYGL